MNNQMLMIATVSFLLVSVYSSTSLYTADAMPVWRPGGEGIKCADNDDGETVSCCKRVTPRGSYVSERYCTTCKDTEPPSQCSPREILME